MHTQLPKMFKGLADSHVPWKISLALILQSHFKPSLTHRSPHFINYLSLL